MKPDTIQYEKEARPHPNKLEKIHKWCVIRWKYRELTPYTTESDNGKITRKVYLEQILSQIITDFRESSLTLYEDQDSAHTSYETGKLHKRNDLDVITCSPKSPDMSVMEIWTKSLKGSFYSRHSWSETPGPKRIEIIFEKLDQDKINGSIEKCIEFGGEDDQILE
jgi:hypothetical protein